MLLRAGFGNGRTAAGPMQPAAGPQQPHPTPLSIRSIRADVSAAPAAPPASSYFCNAGVCTATGDRVVMFTQLQALLTMAMNQGYAISQHAYMGPPITAPAGVIDQSVVNAIISLRDAGIGPTLTPVDVKITPDFVAANVDAISAVIATWLQAPYQTGQAFTQPGAGQGPQNWLPPAGGGTQNTIQCWDGSFVGDPSMCPPQNAPGTLPPPPSGQTTPQFFTCPDGSLVNDPAACQPTTALATITGWFENPVVKWGAIALGLLAGGVIIAKVAKRRAHASSPVQGFSGLGLADLDGLDMKQQRDAILQSLKDQFKTKVRSIDARDYRGKPMELDKFLTDLANNIAQGIAVDDDEE